MILNTKHLGEINIDQSAIITFEEGLLAFDDVKQYVIVENPDSEIPFSWLQSVDEPSLTFIITNPFLFKSDYGFDIPEKVIKQLKIETNEDVMTYSIVVLPQDIKKMTINLSGPIIINMKKKIGKQIILESNEYPVKYYIFQ